MTAFAGEVHPYAARWPMRPADEIEDMAASIRARGLRFPIVLTPEGVLVDGRNRLAACTLADVEPAFTVDETLADDDEVIAYIWDANGDRRDLNKGQKAMLAALRPGTQISVSENAGVSSGRAAEARMVLKWCDDKVIQSVRAAS